MEIEMIFQELKRSTTLEQKKLFAGVYISKNHYCTWLYAYLTHTSKIYLYIFLPLKSI